MKLFLQEKFNNFRFRTNLIYFDIHFDQVNSALITIISIPIINALERTYFITMINTVIILTFLFKLVHKMFINIYNCLSFLFVLLWLMTTNKLTFIILFIVIIRLFVSSYSRCYHFINGLSLLSYSFMNLLFKMTLLIEIGFKFASNRCWSLIHK